MSEMTMADTIPLVHTSIVLNLAYYTFRDASKLTLQHYKKTFDGLEQVEERALGLGNKRLAAQIFVLGRNNRVLLAEMGHAHLQLDSFLLFAGYSIAMVYLYLLYVATCCPTQPVSSAAVGAIYFVGCTPVVISLVTEIVFRCRYSLHIAKAQKLLKEANLPPPGDKGESSWSST